MIENNTEQYATRYKELNVYKRDLQLEGNESQVAGQLTPA